MEYCVTGKVRYSSRLNARTVLHDHKKTRRPRKHRRQKRVESGGSVYECPDCQGYHISSRPSSGQRG